MTATPFPSVGAPFVDPRSGSIQPVWRSLLATLWQNQGGPTAYTSAPAIGNPNQPFQVGVAITNEQAVPFG